MSEVKKHHYLRIIYEIRKNITMTHPTVKELEDALANGDVGGFLALVDRWDPALIEPWEMTKRFGYLSAAFREPSQKDAPWETDSALFDNLLWTARYDMGGDFDEHPDVHKVVRKLLQLGANPNARLNGGIRDGEAGLYMAAEAGDVQSVLAYLEAGADINGRDPVHPSTYIPLFAAVQNGHVACTTMLLRHGADVNIIGDGGDGVMFYTISCPEMSIIAALIAAGADVNALDEEGASVLYYLADLCSYPSEDFPEEIIKLLRVAGAQEIGPEEEDEALRVDS